MERDEFKILVKAMKAVYADATFIPDSDAFNVWYELLKDIPYNQAEIAIQKHMLTNTFPPRIADIRRNVSEITETEEINELEAWSMVYKAICNSAYNAEREYQKLPQIVQKAVGNPANLREWAMMDEKMISSARARFIDSFKAVKGRIKEDSMIPERTKIQIAQMKDNAAALMKKKEPIAEIDVEKETKAKAERCPPPENLRERLSALLGE